jgi:hypothetical protein
MKLLARFRESAMGEHVPFLLPISALDGEKVARLSEALLRQKLRRDLPSDLFRG